MMYYLKKEYEHFTEEHSHDLWIMIRTLQEAPLHGPPGTTYSTQRETGNQMLKKYYLTAEEKAKEGK